MLGLLSVPASGSFNVIVNTGPWTENRAKLEVKHVRSKTKMRRFRGLIMINSIVLSVSRWQFETGLLMSECWQCCQRRRLKIQCQVSSRIFSFISDCLACPLPDFTFKTNFKLVKQLELKTAKTCFWLDRRVTFSLHPRRAGTTFNYDSTQRSSRAQITSNCSAVH